jgi:hypothetical protein
VSQLIRSARSITPFTRNLLLFAIASVALGNLIAVVLPTPDRGEFTLVHTGEFFAFRAYWDSWLPMTKAWEYLRTPGAGDVYDHVWLDLQLKFQYPLTSLFAIQAAHIVLPGETVRWSPLNLASWLGVWGTAVLTALIFRDACREHLNMRVLRGASRADEWVRMGIAFGLTLAFYPVVEAFTVGQVQAWINFAFAAMLFLWMKRIPWAAGLMAGLICVLKPQLALLVVWAAIRRQWRFVAVAVAVAAPAFLAALAVYGLQQNLNYVSFLSFLSRHGEADWMNHSVNGMVNRLLDNGDNLRVQEPSFSPFSWPAYLSTLISSVALIGLAMLWRRGESEDAPVMDLAIAGLSFTMASPIAWDHHYGILMPIYAALLPAMIRRPVFGPASVAYLGLAFFVSANIFYATRYAADTPFSLVQSYLLFAAVMVLVALYRVRHALATVQEPVEESVEAEARETGFRRAIGRSTA